MNGKLQRLRITITYLTGEEQEFFSYNLPKVEGEQTLINTDYGVVAIPNKDLLKVNYKNF